MLSFLTILSWHRFQQAGGHFSVGLRGPSEWEASKLTPIWRIGWSSHGWNLESGKNKKSPREESLWVEQSQQAFPSGVGISWRRPEIRGVCGCSWYPLMAQLHSHSVMFGRQQPGLLVWTKGPASVSPIFWGISEACADLWVAKSTVVHTAAH